MTLIFESIINFKVHQQVKFNPYYEVTESDIYVDKDLTYSLGKVIYVDMIHKKIHTQFRTKHGVQILKVNYKQLLIVK